MHMLCVDITVHKKVTNKGHVCYMMWIDIVCRPIAVDDGKAIHIFRSERSEHTRKRGQRAVR